MREWLWPLLPVVVVAYFLVYPDQFASLVVWSQHVMR